MWLFSPAARNRKIVFNNSNPNIVLNPYKPFHHKKLCLFEANQPYRNTISFRHIGSFPAIFYLHTLKMKTSSESLLPDHMVFDSRKHKRKVNSNKLIGLNLFSIAHPVDYFMTYNFQALPFKILSCLWRKPPQTDENGFGFYRGVRFKNTEEAAYREDYLDILGVF